MAASTALPIDSALAQGVKRTSTATGGASRNIILRAVVRPFCKLSKVHHGIRLRGKTDGGASIDSTIGSEGGFTVICNKPYAMNLERHPVFGPPSNKPKRRRAETTDPFDFDPGRLPVYGTPDLLIERRRVATSNPNEAFALARGEPDVDGEDADEEIAERDYEVVLSVEFDRPADAVNVRDGGQRISVCLPRLRRARERKAAAAPARCALDGDGVDGADARRGVGRGRRHPADFTFAATSRRRGGRYRHRGEISRA